MVWGSKRLIIHIIATKRAYEESEKDRFICTIPGKGSYVASHKEEALQKSKMRMVEDRLQEAIELGKLIGLSGEALEAMFTLLLEDD